MIGEEFQKIFYCSQLLNLFLDTVQLSNKNLLNFLKECNFLTSSNKKAKNYNQIVKYDLRNKPKQLNNDVLMRIRDESKFETEVEEEIVFLKSLRYKNVYYRIEDGKSKFNNSCVSTKDTNLFEVINLIFLFKDEPYAMCSRVVKLDNPFFPSTICFDYYRFFFCKLNTRLLCIKV